MNTPSTKSVPALLLQVAVVLIGLVALGLLLWEPHLEGRNAHATVFEIYFKDPFLAYVYVGSIPFFLALRRTFRLLGDRRRTGNFSSETVDALLGIERCGLALLAFVAGAAVMIVLFGDGEDRPAGLFMSALAALIAGGIATAAALSARHLQRTLPPPGAPARP
jgi:hypothetical protein